MKKEGWTAEREEERGRRRARFSTHSSVPPASVEFDRCRVSLEHGWVKTVVSVFKLDDVADRVPHRVVVSG